MTGRPWSTEELAYLRENAGTLTRREICLELRRSRKSVERMAARHGISLRTVRRTLVWCHACARWRTSVNDSGLCPVCNERAKTEREEERCAEELAAMDAPQRAAFDATEARRAPRKKRPPAPAPPDTGGMAARERTRAEEAWEREVEAWELELETRRYNAAKQRLKRIRAVLGTNPRKNNG